MIQIEIHSCEVAFTSSERLTFRPARWNFDSPHSIMVLTGDNGTGKTTLLNLLSGFSVARRGSVRASGDATTAANGGQAQSVSFVRSFQIPMLCAELTVRENILLPLFTRSLALVPGTRADILPSIAESLSPYLDISPLELSFGQRRLVELARLELQIRDRQVGLVLLDEPLAGLDAANRRIARQLVARLSQRSELMIWIEHDLGTDLPSSARIVRMTRQADGSIDFDDVGRASEIGALS